MPDKRLWILGALAFAAAIAFMTVGLRGNVAFALELRAVRLLTLVQVGVAIAISTVVFQTVTANRVLTPQIMGLDALYLFGQMALVVALGSVGFVALDPRVKFAGEACLMMVMALLLFLPMLRRRFDVGLLLLTGVVLGVLFRSLASLIARLIDPNEFAVVQASSFADFNTVRPDLVVVGLVVTVIAAAITWRKRHLLDVLALGSDSAIGLGVNWTRALTGLLMLVAALVAVSTALVGPVTFFGLLVVALAERIINSRRHHLLLPAAMLTAVIVLLGGQTLLQHVLGGASTLGVVIEFVGGLAFLGMLITTSKR
ncbi:iron chelate uptake ABC transporter family permease subunit [Aminobacter sp. AP02]|uniref:iron chelate uptake ABC transporter family permease subunit n=1 Tax=Aminobacter sp. AP02 TaxID=2135737 RepID=UPI000D79E657|nr:iron chelate uptake ABC transporter family permease subunit [Aminobacter sp. AP02]PWK77009.1 iron complex transport system permease protein [Aminobacter sp. AP02]